MFRSVATNICITAIYILASTGCKKEYATPTLKTVDVYDITFVSAKSGGEIIDNGGISVIERGVCWSTSPNPTIKDNHTLDGEGSGRYFSTMDSLSAGTTYYVRAYATNSAGTDYGDQVSFKTAVLNAELTTAEISEITQETALSGGNITKEGGSPVVARGVCWSTSENPTIADNKTTDGTGSGSFVSMITNLLASTRYYVRAYATNSSGTVYGNQLSFTTSEVVPPSITTGPVSGLTSSSAISGGIISVKGGVEILANGVCWSTSENPTIADNFTSDRTDSVNFTSTITGLSNGTVYYVRAYATNSAGTSYGDQISFITPVTDIEGNIYKTVVIGNQIWMAENLKTTIYNDNAGIPNVPGNAEWMALTTPAYSWYENNITNKDIYGALYNWYAVSSGRLCPAGWHAPTDQEFNTLELYLGLPASEINVFGFRGTDQGTRIKSTTTWTSGLNGTNSSGFNALAAGYRQYTAGSFVGLGIITYFWSSSDDAANGHPEVGWYRRVDNSDPRIFKATTIKSGGKYVRCLKD